MRCKAPVAPHGHSLQAPGSGVVAASAAYEPGVPHAGATRQRARWRG